MVLAYILSSTAMEVSCPRTLHGEGWSWARLCLVLQGPSGDPTASPCTEPPPQPAPSLCSHHSEEGREGLWRGLVLVRGGRSISRDLGILSMLREPLLPLLTPSRSLNPCPTTNQWATESKPLTPLCLSFLPGKPPQWKETWTDKGTYF